MGFALPAAGKPARGRTRQAIRSSEAIHQVNLGGLPDAAILRHDEVQCQRIVDASPSREGSHQSFATPRPASPRVEGGSGAVIQASCAGSRLSATLSGAIRAVYVHERAPWCCIQL
jgi:hypothetical protein